MVVEYVQVWMNIVQKDFLNQSQILGGLVVFGTFAKKVITNCALLWNEQKHYSIIHGQVCIIMVRLQLRNGHLIVWQESKLVGFEKNSLIVVGGVWIEQHVILWE